MNELDNQIRKIFDNLLYSTEAEYTGDLNPNRNFPFKFRGVDVILEIFNKDDSEEITNKPITLDLTWHSSLPFWEVRFSSGKGYQFILVIDGRQYNVVGLNRVEEAKALTRLEEILQKEEHYLLERLSKINIPDHPFVDLI